ncbi:hypothetical protein FKM82_002897 [Ascaphus truei]
MSVCRYAAVLILLGEDARCPLLTFAGATGRLESTKHTITFHNRSYCCSITAQRVKESDTYPSLGSVTMARPL